MTTGLLLLAGSAAAEEPWTAARPTISAQLDYGIFTGDDEGTDLNPYGLGIGLKGGYTLDQGVYVGGAFDYFFGGSEEGSVPGVGSGEVSFNIWTLQAEVGYDLGLMPEAVLRPKLGLGLTSLGGESCFTVGGQENCEDGESQSNFSLSPGAQFLYSLDGPFITADVRYNIVFTSDNEGDGNGLLFGVGAGYAF